jgi:hypothetical protein
MEQAIGEPMRDQVAQTRLTEDIPNVSTDIKKKLAKIRLAGG